MVDVTLAVLLGAVGIWQLAGQRDPFGEKRPRPSGYEGGGPSGGGSGPFPGGGGGPPEPDTLTYLLFGLCAASLAVRSRFPLLTLAGVTAFGAAYLETGQPVFPVLIIVLVAIYSAVADSSLPRFVPILLSLGSGAILGAAIWLSDAPRTNAQWAMDAAWVLAAIFLGDSVRSRRETAEQLERSREEEERRRVSDERLRIARELHDVVGHNISLINVQAGAGAHVLYNDPQQSRETFDNIRTASHETLQELRSLVGVLRDPATGESRTPTVGLDALEQLIKGFVDAGQDVTLEVTGNKRHVSGIVDLSAYRILQEALTNTVRHAPKSKVRVMVNYGEKDVSLTVTNDSGDGVTAREPGGGHGLVGMRERVMAIGGRLDAGPDANGGFHVRAVLPLGAAT
jgi:signal transduction histidine kinase